MNGKNVLGMIFANIREETLETLWAPFLSVQGTAL